jgi:hypothetical protein
VAQERLSVRKIRKVFRLRAEGFSEREIAHGDRRQLDLPEEVIDAVHPQHRLRPVERADLPMASG